MIMKLYKIITPCAILFFFITSCKKEDFVNANIDPNVLYAVDPGDQFLAASSGSQDDFEYYYDVYRDEMPWLQYSTPEQGNGFNFTGVGSNFNYRYGKIFYGRVGTYLSDIPNLVSKMSTADQAKRVYEVAIAAIFKAYYAFYVSDINGSIPYSQAFQARYGGTLTPVYDPQQELFDTLDVQIKSAIATLESSQSDQILYEAKDPFFGSSANEVSEWIRTGNALRLKIAMRLMKRDPNKLKAIATEVLSDANQMSSVDDSWVLLVGPSYADATGNWNPNGFAAAKPVVDFFLAHGDPRLRIFYRPNKDGQYVGSYTNPDASHAPQNAPLYTVADTLSLLQHRIFTPSYDEGDGNGVGDGVGFYPYLTYAEYCFLRAELAARNIISDDAGAWYTKGVTASITFYDQRATAAKITGYTAVGETEINNYLASPGIAFDASKAVDQIACQAYIDFYRQPSEAWAWWKRTDYPNTTSVLAWESLTSNGAPLTLPRRAPLTPLPETDANYANQQAAFAEMEQDPGFGSPQDPNGRVWWDVQ
jgi:hypothetical protein